MRTLLWFRGRDLRVADNPALRAALAGGELIPLFVFDEGTFRPAAARRRRFRVQFLLESVASLSANLAHLGSRLVTAAGRPLDLLPRLAAEWRVERVIASAHVEPRGRDEERRLTRALGVPLELVPMGTLCAPGSRRTGAGEPYAVFSPFARAFLRDVRVAAPVPAPRALPPLPSDVREPGHAAPSLESLGLSRNEQVPAGGEREARARLSAWLRGDARDYDERRDRLDIDGGSRLSADLARGTLSPRTVWHAVDRALRDLSPDALRAYQNELLWREFAHSTLHDRPRLLHEPFRAEWRDFPWRTGPDADRDFDAWTDGRTGYPVVDAAARQLRATGFLPNRARMIAASFLAKHLLIDFRRGERHYLDLLVDADVANNDMGWQWAAGCGCDAQPWFRIFNPVTQGQKFDPAGDYVRRWVPELAAMPARHLHAPWTAPGRVRAGTASNYPPPIVPHEAARRRFLDIAKRHFR